MKRWLALSVAVALGAVGCAGCAVHIPPIPENAYEVTPPRDLEGALEEQVGERFRPDNQIALSENGQVFHDIAAAISKAKVSVNIVTFIWRPSGPSDEVLVPLLERARAGVKCRVVVDALGSRRFAGQVRPLLEGAGCEVRMHRPREDDVLERNHRKIVVVDGVTGITGGFGIWKSWEGNGLEKDEWRDSNVVVRGPVVRELQRAFEASWIQAGGDPLPAGDLLAPPPAGDTRALFVASGAQDLDGGADRTRVERATVLLIRSATKRIWIANSYFVPSTEILSLLVAKSKSGVDVRVLAPGPIHDWTSIRAAQRDGYPELVAAGVKIFEYQPSMMHSKTMVVDDRLVIIGSTNLDPLSLRQMEEGSLVVEDAALARELEQHLEQDFRWSKAILHPTAGPYAWASRLVVWLIGKL
ncbi:MAG TPA: phospholipase D-like domain-containing protein [Myxococcaceae bacterium]|nr:phospholipase D-like domain-containing protein [Myxococcaceae bacterium]